MKNSTELLKSAEEAAIRLTKRNLEEKHICADRYVYGAEAGYIQGYADGIADRKAIDIDKACREVEEMLYNAKRLGIHSIPHLVANFRKAMEE